MEPLVEAGGRLFMDATRSLKDSLARKVTLQMIGKMDALIASAARQILDRFPVKEKSTSDWEGLEEMLPGLRRKCLRICWRERAKRLTRRSRTERITMWIYAGSVWTNAAEPTK